MSIKFNGLKIRVSLVQILVPAPLEFLNISGGYSILTVTAFFIVNSSVSCRHHGNKSKSWIPKEPGTPINCHLCGTSLINTTHRHAWHGNRKQK